VRGVSGVGAASAYVTTKGRLMDPDEGTSARHQENDYNDLPLQGVTAPDVRLTSGLPVTSGSLADLTGNSVALPADLAGQPGDGLGQRVTMRLGDGTKVNLRVVAVFSGVPGFDTALLPAQLLAAHTTTGLAGTVLVRAAPGVDHNQLLSSLRTFAAGQPGLRVADASVLTAQARTDDQTGAWVSYLLVAMIVGYTVISLVNTLIMNAMARRKEFALHRVIGSTGGQLLAMMGLEGLLVALAGIVLGTMVALGTLLPFSITEFGYPALAGPLWIYLVIVVAAVALSIGGSILPTAFTLRRQAVREVSIE
jgi:putative ABC transport system permease protein